MVEDIIKVTIQSLLSDIEALEKANTQPYADATLEVMNKDIRESTERYQSPLQAKNNVKLTDYTPKYAKMKKVGVGQVDLRDLPSMGAGKGRKTIEKGVVGGGELSFNNTHFAFWIDEDVKSRRRQILPDDGSQIPDIVEESMLDQAVKIAIDSIK